MTKAMGQHTSPHTALGQHAAGTRPKETVTVLHKPEDCLCAWDMHGERNEEGFYTGLYWFTLKFRYTDCPSKRNGEHR